MSMQTAPLTSQLFSPVVQDAAPIEAQPNNLFFFQLLTQLLNTSAQDANPPSPFMAQAMQTLGQRLEIDADRMPWSPQDVEQVPHTASAEQADRMLESLLGVLQIILQAIPPTALENKASGSPSGSVEALLPPPETADVTGSEMALKRAALSALHQSTQEVAGQLPVATELTNDVVPPPPTALNVQTMLQRTQTLETPAAEIQATGTERAIESVNDRAQDNSLATLEVDSTPVETRQGDVPLVSGNPPAAMDDGRSTLSGRRFSIVPAEVATRLLGHPLPPHTVLLQLEPPQLGHLQVHLHVTDERITAAFWADSPSVRALLQAHFPTLSETLSAQGIDPQQVSISLATNGFQGDASAFSQRQSGFLSYAPDNDPSLDAGYQPQGTEEAAQPITHRHHGLLDLVI